MPREGSGCTEVSGDIWCQYYSLPGRSDHHAALGCEKGTLQFGGEKNKKLLRMLYLFILCEVLCVRRGRILEIPEKTPPSNKERLC